MSTTSRSADDTKAPLRLAVGPSEVVISNRHESLSIANDLLIALDFLARPVIRLARPIHLRRIRADTNTEQSG